MEAFLNTVDETNRAITEEGMIARAKAETEPVEEETPKEEPVEQVVEVDEEVLDSISDRAVQALTPLMDTITGTVEAVGRQLEELAQTVSTLDQRISQNATKADERLRELERDEDDKLTELVNDMPPRSKLRITHRPREANNPESGELPSPGERAAAIDWTGH
jgi:methyl-accepting chemotaxis protein